MGTIIGHGAGSITGCPGDDGDDGVVCLVEGGQDFCQIAVGFFGSGIWVQDKEHDLHHKKPPCKNRYL